MTSLAGIRFCTSADGSRIAMAVDGAGPPLISVKLHNSNDDLDEPGLVTRHWAQALPRHFQHVRYDPRGCGMSDRDMRRCSLDAWVEDLEAVVDSLGAPRVALMAFGNGAPVAIRYAVRHPQRVSQLVFYGGYVRGRLRRDLSEPQVTEALALIQAVKAGFDNDSPYGAALRRVFGSRMFPAAKPDQLDAMDAVAIKRMSGDVAAQYARASFELDVSSEASQVACPTIVFHARGDMYIPFEEGRLLASLIPGATFVPLDAVNHVPLEADPEFPRVLNDLVNLLAPGGAPTTAALTPRQAEVLRLIGKGLTDKQIARALELSPRTIEMHVSRTLDTLRCHTRAEAVRVATERGLL